MQRLSFALVFAALVVGVGLAQPSARAADEKTLLQYKLASGEKVQWRVEHLATTETKIQGTTQTSQSRSVSTKVWTVSHVAPGGDFTIVHSVADVEMWQKVSGRPEVRYDSKSDKQSPPGYEQVAESVGAPLATVVINPAGRIVRREGSNATRSFGLGSFAVPLPEAPVKIGHQWEAPGEIIARLPQGAVKRVKIRKLYTLESVSTGVATINVRTEVLTPIDDPKVKSQIVQQITHGAIKFDVDAGRVISQQMDWDETVIGFNGPDSVMKYLARFTEKLQSAAAATAKKPNDASQRK